MRNMLVGFLMAFAGGNMLAMGGVGGVALIIAGAIISWPDK